MNPLIALWSHPRSMSTAIERIMRERGDLDCAHEPFMYDYYIHRKVRQMPHFETEPDHPVAYAEIRDMLLERAGEKPVFFKDMAYYMTPYMFEDTAFFERVTHCFLIRDPMASILSYHKLDSEMTSEEVGLKGEWDLFDTLRSRYGLAPVVIEAEAVQADARGVVGKWWEALGLSFVPGAFEWDAESRPEDWQQVGQWHQDVSGSGAIRAASDSDIARRAAKFAERAAKFPRLTDLLAEHQPYYERLRSHSLTGDRSGLQ